MDRVALELACLLRHLILMTGKIGFDLFIVHFVKEFPSGNV